MKSLEQREKEAVFARFSPGTRAGHYESFFLRANHPSRPLAFWVRYTLMSPQHRPEAGIGELWAVWFDGEKKQNIAVKNEVPIANCVFSQNKLEAIVEGARLDESSLRGGASANGHRLEWDLRYTGNERPLFLMQHALYDLPLPRAKSLVGLPLATFSGRFALDGEDIPIDGWVGSQNHNWGTKHTDRYGWCQVAGFDNDPSAFLEVATARLRFGPVWSPWLTPLVLRQGGREIQITRLDRAARAKGSYSFFEMDFETCDDDYEVKGFVRASREDFVGLRYMNPPGGDKHCLNSKLAACEVEVRDKKQGGAPLRLVTKNRAAFEILTDERDHGVPIQV